MTLDPKAFVADRELLNSIEPLADSLDCVSEKVLFCQGDEPTGVFVLRTGAVELSMVSHSGDMLMNTVVNAGSLIGLPGVIGDQPYSLSAVAYPGSELGFIPIDRFADFMRRNPNDSMKVLQVLAAEVRSARAAIGAA